MTSHAKPTRRTVSLAIPAPDGSEGVLVVLRPPDDPDLPNVWGLPAGRLAPEESVARAARRIAREKLGVEVADPTVLEEGGLERPGYRLEMALVRARIASGEPRVPQAGTGVTQYVDWRWGMPGVLEPAAEKGSLCCRLFLANEEAGKWNPGR